MQIRGKGIGGSDSSAILGLNPYRTNLELWQSKLGIKSFDNIDNKFTIYGKATEEHIRGIFKADYVNILKVSYFEEVLVRKDKPYLRASLDGELGALQDFSFMSYWKKHYNKESEIVPKPIIIKKGMKGVLEIKTTEVLSSMHKEKWNNQIPMNYYTQVLHYLNVTGYDFVILVAQLTWEDNLGVRTKETRHYGFLKEGREIDLKYLEEQEDIFWNEYILKGIEPPLKLSF